MSQNIKLISDTNSSICHYLRNAPEFASTPIVDTLQALMVSDFASKFTILA